MNITDLIQSYFEGDNAKQLGQAVGLDGAVAQKALAAGLPLQLGALAQHAAHPEGQQQILEAVSSLPQFGSVGEVLGSSDGASNLQRAGELLAPALLGGQAEHIVNTVTGQVGGSVGGVQKILHMALPLVLSLLGRQGLNAGNMTSLLSPFTGAGSTLGAAAGAVAGAAGVARLGGAAGLGTATTGGVGGLLELLKAQFSGAAADKIGAAAGFNSNAAGRAVQGTLPVILNAIANKSKTEAGAGELLKQAGQFGPLTGPDGQVKAELLGDSAELTRIESQGRGLLGGLFGNVEGIAGRLGTGLGGSGSSTSRLLALLTPLVLSALGKHSAGMNAAALSGLLGGVNPAQLTALLPAGLTGLGALLGGSALAEQPGARPEQVVVAKAEPEAKTVSTPPPAPRPVTPPPPAQAATPVNTEKRGGFPWWLLPLILLLLLGGCWLLKPKPAPTTATPTTSTADRASTTSNSASSSASSTGTTASGTSTSNNAATSTGTFAIIDPAADAKLPAGGFTLKGTGKAGDQLEVFQDDTSLGKVTVGSDGTWSQDVPSPTPGAHTYSVKGPDGSELGKVATTIAAAAANASAANCTKAYTLSMKDGQTVNEPFLFGGVGKGSGYTVTVKRGERVIGTKPIPLDSTCGWSYQSKPGKGKITYEVRPTGDASAAPLSTINLTVN